MTSKSDLIERARIENYIDSIEVLAEEKVEEDRSLELMRFIRAELSQCHMKPEARDEFVARTDVHIEADLTDDQMKRLVAAVRKLVYNFYMHYSRECGYSDGAIALMAHHIRIHI